MRAFMLLIVFALVVLGVLYFLERSAEGAAGEGGFCAEFAARESDGEYTRTYAEGVKYLAFGCFLREIR